MSSRYSMEFNMDSGPRGRSIVASSDNKALSTKGVPSSHTSLPRDASQRFAREITELEYKLLEEKTRAHECEKQLKEEIMLERGRIPHMVNEKVNQIMKDREKEMREEILSSLSASRGDGGHTEVNALRQELERVRQQVKKYQQMQMDTEKRHQDERIEALDTRTGQLRGDTAKRAQEGDIIGRAMQVMCEYEDIVHSSEESTLARLAHHMECFEKEWIRRTREFESQKGDFEARVMEKALSALQSHSEDIGAIGKRITEKTINLLKNQGETRMKLEEEVLEHSEAFKKQYKDILEHEFRERCRAYDEKFADRERSLLHIIQSEREKIIAAERKAVEKHEDAYMGAMAEAMREISELRKQLLQEHQETQSRGIQKLLARRDEMAKEQENIISEANSRVEKIEKQCFEAVDTAQKALVEMQAKIAARESDMAEKLLTVDVEREKVRVAELTKVRVEVDKQWKEIVDELSQRHSDELANQLKELQTRIDFIHSQQFEREQELRQNYETKLVRMEEAADERWSRRLQETSKSLDRHLEVIQVLRDDNERLLSQVASLQRAIRTPREGDFFQSRYCANGTRTSVAPENG